MNPPAIPHVDAMNDGAVRKHLKILRLQMPDTGWLKETRNEFQRPARLKAVGRW
jgi:hypothetical protein